MSTPAVLVESVRRSPSLRVQPFALPLLFIVFGMIMGSWAGRIPALREGVQISHSALSLVLLCGGLGAVISFPISSRLMRKFGGRKTLFYSGSALLAVLVCIGMAPTVPLLMLAVLMLGITASCFDVGVNSVATSLEKLSGKASLSRMHACGGAGGLVGATFGSLMAGAQISPARHFAMIALPLAFALWVGYSLLQDDGRPVTVEKKSFSLPRGPMALLGALGFFGALAEGSIADWSGVYLKDHFSVSDGFAPLALSAFSITMLIARLYGDRLKERFGARRLLSCSATLAAGGLLLAVMAPNSYCALVGFAIAGLGLSVVFPFVFSAAGREGPMALTGVATMTYTGTLMGPPIVGSVAHGLGMQAAMGFVAVFAMAIALIASKTSMLK